MEQDQQDQQKPNIGHAIDLYDSRYRLEIANALFEARKVASQAVAGWMAAMADQPDVAEISQSALRQMVAAQRTTELVQRQVAALVQSGFFREVSEAIAGVAASLGSLKEPETFEDPSLISVVASPYVM